MAEEDKELFYASLPTIMQNLDFFVLRFYYYFFQTDAFKLFQHVKLNYQYKMFYISIKTMIAHIETPDLLEDQLDKLVSIHKSYGVTVEHVDYFINSFNQALSDIFTNQEKSETIAVWYKIIIRIMNYFEKELRKIS